MIYVPIILQIYWPFWFFIHFFMCLIFICSVISMIILSSLKTFYKSFLPSSRRGNRWCPKNLYFSTSFSQYMLLFFNHSDLLKAHWKLMCLKPVLSSFKMWYMNEVTIPSSLPETTHIRYTRVINNSSSFHSQNIWVWVINYLVNIPQFMISESEIINESVLFCIPDGYV